MVLIRKGKYHQYASHLNVNIRIGSSGIPREKALISKNTIAKNGFTIYSNISGSS